MFDDLLIHPRTLSQLKQFITKPSHGLILTGPEGAGKRTLAQAISAVLLNVQSEKLANYPYYTLTDPSESNITIDEIRALQRLLSLKTPSREVSNINRIMVIIDAGRMRFEAQNAFLKSLEEPPTDTCIILTAEANGGLLETIYSRVQRIDVLPVSESLAKEYFGKQGISAIELAKNYALSQGQVGLLSSLLVGDAENPLKQWVERGKQLLSAPAAERILQTDELSKDKANVVLLLNALGRISHAALSQSAKTGNIKAMQRWKNSLETVQYSQMAILRNANTKLLLDHLLLTI
jgi:replication-associated recombination protein RarA